VIEGHVNDGFGLLFAGRAEAEPFLGSRSTPAPLGTISKQKDSGDWKHRVIMDLKANGVNLASGTPERQVLPTVFHHGLDMAVLGDAFGAGGADSDDTFSTMVLDLKDAFMGVPLARCEWGFNCCAADLDIHRTRKELYAG